MNRIVRTCFLPSLMLTMNVPGSGRMPPEEPLESGLNITVWVFNLAQIDREGLERAKSEAARVLHQVGVKIDWLDCPTSQAEVEKYPGCQQLPAATGLVLRIRPRSPATHMVTQSAVFGYTLLPADGGFGVYADVYVDGADQLANGRESLRAVMLGHLMAHELGHLLLGTERHAAAGIMHSPWTEEERLRAAQGVLWFSRRERKQIQAAVRERMRAAGGRD